AARPLDRARPLWELYLIHGVDGDRVAVLTKVHHAAIDGLSGAEILSVLLDPSPEGRSLPAPTATPVVRNKPGQLEMLARGLAGIPQQRVRSLRGLARALPHLDETPTMRTLPGISTVAALSRRGSRRALHAPRTSLNVPIGPHRRVAFTQQSLDEVKQIKNHFGVTVNDVVVAVCAGALRTWLQDRGELPDRPLLAMIPVSLRTEAQRGTYGNRITTMLTHARRTGEDSRGTDQRRHLQRPRLARAAVPRRGTARGDLPRLGDRARRRPQHDRHGPRRRAQLRRRRRPRRGRRRLAAGHRDRSGARGAGRAHPGYIASIWAAYFAAIARRLSLDVGVSSSPSGCHSRSITLKRLICSTRDSCWLAASTADCTALDTAGSSAARPSAATGSSVISAVLYGRASPIQTGTPISGEADFSVASMLVGDMFLPAALMMSSLMRSTILR